jgi:hypothetical protein
MPVHDPEISAAAGLPSPLSDAVALRLTLTGHAATRHVLVNSNGCLDLLAASYPDVGPVIALLARAYPEFSIGQSSRGRHGLTWTVIRKDATQPGLYAVVTPDLGELRDILSRHAGSSGPET